MIKLANTSLKRLEGVDSRLVRVVKHAAEISDLMFNVSEGLRTKERQEQLFKEKKTKTLNSKHLVGRAVDLYPIENGKIAWNKFEELSKIMFKSAEDCNVKITWGGNWKFVDKPHYEI
jgi:peptidoglycan L-alanyl-D-glutamate endopeptidase CwlK